MASAFYYLLHWVEVGWRNAMHGQLQRHFGRADWWAVAPLDANGRNKVRRAQGQLDRRKAALGTPDDLVTEFTFGFWVSLLSRGKAYDRTLWVPALHRAFPYYSGLRRGLHGEAYVVLPFRNRIMHYEPIFGLDLMACRETIYRSCSAMSRRAWSIWSGTWIGFPGRSPGGPRFRRNAHSSRASRCPKARSSSGR